MNLKKLKALALSAFRTKHASVYVSRNPSYGPFWQARAYGWDRGISVDWTQEVVARGGTREAAKERLYQALQSIAVGRSV